MQIKKSNLFSIIAISITIGLWVAIWVGELSNVIPLGKSSKAVIEQCQKDLPRDQYCTIIAVPENEIEGG